jgi:SAM-dependent methyltransferase
MTVTPQPARRCPACDLTQPVAQGDPLWPSGWSCPSCGHEIAQVDGIQMFAPELADTVSGFDPTKFAALAAVEDTHFWFVTRNELLVGLVLKFFPQARRFLEIGCGNGAVLHALARAKPWELMVGSELHPAGLRFARERLPRGVDFVQMDATRIPAVGVFDLTGAFDVIEHIADDEAVLRGLRQATRHGGGTIISVPQHPWLWSPADDSAHHQRRYKLGELETKLRRHGFEVLFSSSFTALLLPLMIVSRAKAQKENAADRFDREFSISPRINKMLIAVLRTEIRMTLAGLRWPLGGSRVVVARAV